MSENRTKGSDRTPANAPGEDPIVYYDLVDILPPGHVMALHKGLGTLTLLAFDKERAAWPRLLAQQQFSVSELSVLRPLLDAYPSYCPHEVIWASFNTGQTTDEIVARARVRLQEAQFAGVWDHEMRPVRNILSRTRFKLRQTGLDVRSILETGYMLIQLPRKAKAEEWQ
jgi:hypothetical protein